MRKSQIVVLSATGAVALIIVAAIVTGRIIVAQIDAGQYSGDVQRAAPAESATAASLDLSGFERIDARGRWEITLRQSPEFDVALRYPPGAEDRMRVQVDGERLVLGYTSEGWAWWRGFGEGESMEATVSMPVLEGINLSGASELDISGFSGTKLEINASGATEIHGRDGEFDALELIVSGAGDVNLEDVLVDNAVVVLSGAGDITLNMNGGVLSGTVSGAGKVRYHGTVSEETVVASGFSSVEALDR